MNSWVAGCLAGCRPFPGVPNGGPLTAAASSTSVAPLGRSQVVARGGASPYRYRFQETPPASGPTASIDAMGNYLAGSLGPTVDHLVVTDQAGSATVVTIEVGLPLQLAPLAVSVNPGGTATFTAQYGQPPYVFSLVSSCALPDAGLTSSFLDAGASSATYLANPACAGSDDQVSVVDANQAVAGPAVISVGAGLSLFPARATVVPGQVLSFAASGGIPPYTFSFALHGNRSGGAITADGVYRAGPNPSETDLLRVTDRNGLSGQGVVQVGSGSLALPVPEAFALYPSRRSYASTGVVAISFETLSGALPVANVLEYLLATPTGLVPAGTYSFASNVRGVLSTDPNGDVGAGFYYDLAVPFAGADALGELPMALDGLFVAGPLLSPLDPTAGFAEFLPGSGLGQPGFAGFAFATTDAGPETLAVIELYLPTADGGGAGAALAGTIPVPSFSGLASEIVSPIAGRATSLAAIGLSIDSTGGCATSLLRLDGLAVGADGGISVATQELRRVGALPACGGQTSCGPTVGLADLNGDGLEDSYVATLCPTQPGTIDVFLGLPDGGSQALPELTAPAATSLRAGPQDPTLSGGADELDLVGPATGVRLIWDGSTLQWLDAGFPAGTAAVLRADVNGDGLADVVLASDQGQLTVEQGGVLGRVGVGDAFAFPGALFTSPPVAVGAIAGSAPDVVLVGGSGLTLLSGAGVDLLSLEGSWASGTASVAVTPSGGYALAESLAGLGYLAHLIADGGEWVLSATDLSALGVVANQVQPMSAGGALSGGDVLVSGPLAGGAAGLLVQPFAFDGDALLPVGAPLTVGGSAIPVLPLEVNGGAADDLVAIAPEAFPDGGADAELEVFAAQGSPPAWPTQPSEAYSVSALSASGSWGACFQAWVQYELPPQPWSTRFGERPQSLLFLGPATGADGGALGTLACVVGLAPPELQQVVTLPLSTNHAFMGDIDGDGWTDVVASDSSTGNVVVALGLADAGLGPPSPAVSDPSASNFMLVGLGDFDGDGRSDLLLANLRLPYLAVLHSGDGGFD